MQKIALGIIVALLLAGCSEQKETVGSSPPSQSGSASHGSKSKAKRITTAGLLDDMINLRRLAELPQPAYTNRQASSYDRASTTPADAKGWFANGDSGQFIREEENGGRKEHVMMDSDGPGTIVRIWSANPEGTIRIYLDGAEKPAIESPMNELLGGKYAGLPRPIAGEYAKGWNLYFPIPYARHCKVTSDKGGFYYQVNYRTYPSGTPVETFSAAQIQELAAQIQDVGKRLDSPRDGGGPPADRVKTPFDATLSPGKHVEMAKLEGGKAICGLLFHVTASNLPAAARSTVLRISFDGETTVECPLGDFYGSPLLVPYDSFPLGVTDKKPQDLWCHWWMPFKKTARISLINLGTQTVAINGAVATVPYKWTDRTLLFHSKWRIERDIPSRPMTDWAHLEATGQGRFVGGALHVMNTVRGWWGEGDEKIYVDGEKFPSTIGTGSEDYYGYAWCSPDRFIHAYHNQPYCQGPRNYGNTLVNRFHIIDDIPFTQSFKFDMENWHGSPSPMAKTNRAAVSYWYARPGGTDFFKPLTAADVKFDEMPAYKAMLVPGAIEGESMKVIESTGKVEPQALGTPYSNDSTMYWRGGRPGSKLVLGFNAPQSGKRHVFARLAKSNSYGQVKLWINEQPVSEKPFDVDLYDAQNVPTNEIDLGAFDLKEGQNTLAVQIVGANAEAKKRYLFGLDYLLLK